MRESGRNVVFSHGGGSDGSDKVNSNHASERRTEPTDALNRSGSLRNGVEKRSNRKNKREGKENNEKVVTIEVPIAETSENKDVEDIDANDEGYGFSVGDFVWGKIKSHPWWPGRIYDPSDASDYALKLRQRNRLLVAYFGDGTFAWCHPSQLKPFEENFEDMVKQSNSKAFVNAVQDAVNEIGRLLFLKMTNLCVSKKSGAELAPSLAKNSGIKDGVLVPENGIEKLSTILFDPAELLSQVKKSAEVIAVSSVLELEILKARLSAFYLSRGGYKLAKYHVPQPVPGLEECLKDETVDKGNSKGTVNAPAQGPFEEDYFPLPASPKFGEISHSSATSGNRLHHRRKQKSIAEIIKEENDHTKVKEGDEREGVINLGKLTGSSGRKKRKSDEDSVKATQLQKIKGSPPHNDQNVPSAKNDGNGGKESTDKDTLSHLRRKNKSVGNNINESETETDKGPIIKEEDLNRKEGTIQIEKGHLSRERKKSKYLSPPFTTPNRGQRKGDKETSFKVSSEPAAVQENTPIKSVALENIPKEPVAVQENIAKEPVAVQDNIAKEPVAVQENIAKEPVAVRENIAKEPVAVQENIPKQPAIEHDQSDKLNSQKPEEEKNKMIDLKKIQASSGEVLSEVRSAAISPQIPKEVCFLEKIGGFVSVFRGAIYREGSYYTMYNKRKPGRKRKNPESEPGKPGRKRKNPESEPGRKKKNPESEPGRKKRNPESEPGSKKKNPESEPGRKKKKPESEPGTSKKPQNQNDHMSPNQDSENRKRRKKTETSSDTPKQKHAAENKTRGKKGTKENQNDHMSPNHDSENRKRRKKTDTSSDTPKQKQAAENKKRGKKGTKENASAAALTVLFGPGSSLPSKSELIKWYSKYGALNEAETDIFYNSYTAQVHFMKTSDAEEAFNQSKNVSPFGSSSVKFELKGLPTGSKSGEHGEKSQKKGSPAKKKDKTPAKQSASHTPVIEASKLNFIKQKLEVMTSMLEGPGGKSPGIKKKLESEIKGLLEDVNKMAESSSS